MPPRSGYGVSCLPDDLACRHVDRSDAARYPDGLGRPAAGAEITRLGFAGSSRA